MGRGFDYEQSDVSRIYTEARALRDETRDLWLGEVARAAPPETRRVLDLGCGTGRFTSPLAVSLGARVIGVDPSRRMLAEARAGDAAIPWIAAAAEALPLRETFDLVFASMIYHHLADPARALSEVARVLRPGGRLVVRTTTLEDLGASYVFLEYFPTALAIDRGRMPAERSVLAAGAAAGLRALECRGMRQLLAADPAEYCARIAKRGFSSLQMISDVEFEAGLAALRRWSEGAARGPIYEPLHLFVFER
ncbi:MAG: class I SAM-dependent methyltransferase [Candidatus Rokuibacteriota bacterium]